MSVVDTSGVGDRGVHEVLKRGAVEEVQAETRIAEEADRIDELTKRIAEGPKWPTAPTRSLRPPTSAPWRNYSSSTRHLRRERSAAEWSVDVDEIIETTEQKGGEVVVFSGEFDPGQQLANLGGIAALLRYRIE